MVRCLRADKRGIQYLEDDEALRQKHSAEEAAAKTVRVESTQSA